MVAAGMKYEKPLKTILNALKELMIMLDLDLPIIIALPTGISALTNVGEIENIERSS